MNRYDLGRFCTETLESAAKRYKTLGFSTIPLQGARNPQQPKLPLIKWARFQHAPPTDRDIADWFAGQDDLGIGIVCGRVSRLLVLDIDDALVASEFRRLHPDLANTFTVKSGTRGLPHFYFRLPVGLVVPTAAYPGADLRGEGSYVVAAPTHVGNSRWEVENPYAIHMLTNADLRVLLRFLAGLKLMLNSSCSSSVEVPVTAQASEFRRLGIDDDLVSVYRYHVSKGRNHALFKAALAARDQGISQEVAVLRLASVHAIEQPLMSESYRGRYQEALRTIQSAYTREPRRVAQRSNIGLSNAAREALLQVDAVAVGRILDAIYTSGCIEQQSLTEAAICEIVRPFKIGRRSVMNALSTKIGDQLVFVAAQSPRIPPEYANAASHTDNLNNSCEMSRGAKRVNIQQRGRPARVYRIPTAVEIAHLLGVQPSGSDEIKPQELANPRAYRQALHERLLERRPGAYPRAWLSKRLGISRWTTRRYETALDIQVRPTYAEQVLSWAMAGTLPEDQRDSAFGVFIQTVDGKRYPALRGIALRLLKQGNLVLLKHQQVNRYEVKHPSVGIPTLESEWATILRQDQSTYIHQSPPSVDSVGIPTPALDQHTGHIAAFNPTQETRTASLDQPQNQFSVGIPTPNLEPTFWICPHCLDFHISPDAPELCTRCDATPVWEVVPAIIWRDAQALKAWWHARHHSHRQAQHDAQFPAVNQSPKLLPNSEALVGVMQARVKGLSFANARKLVQQFGTSVVEKAMRALQNRSQVRSPAGFFISLLRSESSELSINKLQNNNISKGESAADWLKRLAQSKYLSFIANAEEILRTQVEGEVSLMPAY